ncbi:helix-turn-helix domain-containing protein [Lachnoclostridium sp. Marseille-P6806]|uniref:helix-turn-helix domain-containing protein n=1 Tax=Lachnoclostridium sp. Marseille-P6806 TaxID=2364793 RepID=UPI0013EF2D23|nr:AraC family transcriptional regulator [Lachnoclostridium sp. Marseille-P6806]
MIILPYRMTELERIIEIRALISVHYYEYKRNFSFEGEVHNFWEFICVDRGDVDITAGSKKIVLHKDEIAFHEPMEFHDVHTSPHSTPNLIVIAFDCPSPAMDYFRRKVLKINQEERTILASVIREARNCFSGRLDDPYSDHLEMREDQEEGSQQMILLSLTSFLIHLMRRTRMEAVRRPAHRLPSKSTAINDADLQFEKIHNYLEGHLHESPSIEQICRDNLIGRSQLLSLFHKKTGHGVMRYFHEMKIDQAKTLIRRSNKQFSQIAAELGYSSICYFSRQFRVITDMSPSEYAESIQAISEKDRG